MSQPVKAVFPCKEGQGAGLVAMLKEALVDTRAFEGCESVEVYTDADAPDRVILWEKFTKRANHEAYMAWRIETGLLGMLAPILAGDLQITYLTDHPDV